MIYYLLHNYNSIDKVRSPDPIHNINHDTTLCHSCKDNKVSYSNSAVLVIGAMSFIGSSLSIYLHEKGTNVMTVDDYRTSDAANTLMWYRWEKLLASKLSPKLYDMSDSAKVSSLLSKYQVLVYVPTLLFEDKDTEFAAMYSNFISLLKVIHKSYPTLKVVLPIHLSSVLPVQAAWVAAIRNTLVAYHNLFQLNIVIVDAYGVFGPLDTHYQENSLCWHINDVVQSIYESMLSDKCCIHQKLVDCPNDEPKSSLFKQWLVEYSAYQTTQTKTVVMSTYFTLQRNRQYPIEFNKNNFRFMESWFLGLYKVNLNMVIFYDHLDKDFVDTIHRNYPGIEFVEVKASDFHGRASNDFRYFLYYDYLLKHSEISHMVAADLRDVEVYNNPFDPLKVIGDYIYVGLDRPFLLSSAGSSNDRFYPRCLPGINYKKERDMLGNYNAGVLGGSRNTMLGTLNRLMDYLNLNVKENCNMPALFYVFHKFYFDRIFYGWPIQFGFDTKHPGVTSNCIIHKWDIKRYQK